MSEYSKMTLEDAKALLLRIKKEIYRRSGMDENGDPVLSENLRHFNLPILDAPDDSLFDIGYTDDVIRALNGAPIIDTLINIGDFKDLRTVNEYDPIPGAFDITMIEALLSQLESEPYDSASTSCRSACTGLCISNCTSSCSGGCENSCSMCSDQCSGMCSDTCTGCTVTCGVTCGISCGSSCANDSSACAGCSSGCISCTGCSETCTNSCSGCSTTCYTGCNGGVSSYSTAKSCNNSCSTGCGATASSAPVVKPTYGINLYHDGQIYGIAKTDLSGNGTFVLPEFTFDVIDPYHLYKNNIDDEYWSDGYTNTTYINEANKVTADIYNSTANINVTDAAPGTAFNAYKLHINAQQDVQYRPGVGDIYSVKYEEVKTRISSGNVPSTGEISVRSTMGGRAYGTFKTGLSGHTTEVNVDIHDMAVLEYYRRKAITGTEFTCSTNDSGNVIENKFKPGDTVYFAPTLSSYNSYKTLGRKTTQSLALCVAKNIYWTSCTKYRLKSDISTSINIISRDIPYNIGSDAVVLISATKNGTPITGFDPKNWSVALNGNLIELPFTGILSRSDNITVSGDPTITFKIKRTIITRKSVSIDCPKNPAATDARCWCTEYDISYNIETDELTFENASRKQCKLEDNDYVKFDVISQQAGIVDTIQMEAESHLVLGADGKFHGYVYELEAEYHSIPTNYETITNHHSYRRMYGHKGLVGTVLLVDSDGTTILGEISLTSHRIYDTDSYKGSNYEYLFQIPKNAFDSAIVGFQGMNSNLDSSATQMYKLGVTYTLFKNQHIILKAVRE